MNLKNCHANQVGANSETCPILKEMLCIRTKLTYFAASPEKSPSRKIIPQLAMCIPSIAKARAEALQTVALVPEDCRNRRSRRLSDATKVRRFSQQNAKFPTVRRAWR